MSDRQKLQRRAFCEHFALLPIYVLSAKSVFLRLFLSPIRGGVRLTIFRLSLEKVAKTRCQKTI